LTNFGRFVRIWSRIETSSWEKSAFWDTGFQFVDMWDTAPGGPPRFSPARGEWSRGASTMYRGGTNNHAPDTRGRTCEHGAAPLLRQRGSMPWGAAVSERSTQRSPGS